MNPSAARLGILHGLLAQEIHLLSSVIRMVISTDGAHYTVIIVSLLLGQSDVSMAHVPQNVCSTSLLAWTSQPNIMEDEDAI